MLHDQRIREKSHKIFVYQKGYLKVTDDSLTILWKTNISRWNKTEKSSMHLFWTGRPANLGEKQRKNCFCSLHIWREFFSWVSREHVLEFIYLCACIRYTILFDSVGLIRHSFVNEGLATLFLVSCTCIIYL